VTRSKFKHGDSSPSTLRVESLGGLPTPRWATARTQIRVQVSA